MAPEAVENVLLTHASVHDVSVVGMAAEVLGEKIRALVIPRPGDTVSATRLRRHAREMGLSSFAVPDVIEVVDEFPLTGVGKVSKKAQQA